MATELAAGNPEVKRLRRLSRSVRQRRSEGAVVVEGPRSVLAAIEAGAAVEAVFVEPGRHEDVVDRCLGASIDVRAVAAGVLDRVLSTTSPQPIAAVVARPDTSVPARVVEGREGPVVVLAGIGDPGNVGTTIRSVVAAGAGPVLISPPSADPFGPKAIRASAGTVFHAEVHEVDDLPGALRGLRESGWTIIGAAPRGGLPHHDVDLTEGVALVLGGETSGLPAAVADDARVTIGEQGPAESMNVAMAATVLVFEAARQRRASESP